MRYLTFIRSSEKYRDQMPPKALMDAMGRFIERTMKEGALADTGGLLPSKAGYRIRVGHGKLALTDGPFTETKEVIGGWAMLSCETPEQARRIATEFMELHRQHWPEFEGECEVRPVETEFTK